MRPPRFLSLLLLPLMLALSGCLYASNGKMTVLSVGRDTKAEELNLETPEGLKFNAKGYQSDATKALDLAAEAVKRVPAVIP